MPHVTTAVGERIVAWAIVLGTLLWGCWNALVGGYLVLVWAGWLEPQGNDLSLKIIVHFRDPIPFLALFGGLFLSLGILAFLSAPGLFWRKSWGRVLTILVAVLGIYLGLRSLNCGPPIIEETDNVPLGIAQLVYGTAVFAILTFHRNKPVGVSILGLVNFLLGFPIALDFLVWLAEFASIDKHLRDSARVFAMWASLSGFVAGLVMVALGIILPLARWNRFAAIVSLGTAGIVAQMALGVFSLLGAFAGHDSTRGGFLAGMLLFVFLPPALLLLLLSGFEAWYLNKPPVRRALRAER